jgi:hypothetical protein
MAWISPRLALKLQPSRALVTPKNFFRPTTLMAEFPAAAKGTAAALLETRACDESTDICGENPRWRAPTDVDAQGL